jgi:hypothetical protein
MTEVSRRQFLLTASVGAAAAGVLAVAGPNAVSAIEAAGGSPIAAPLGPFSNNESGAQEGSDVFARVIDAKAGHIRIFMGTKSVDYTNQAMAQQLLQAAQ